MNKSVLKNMVVLKNLPSNIVDEAIVILKPNKKVKKLEKVDKSEKNKNSLNSEIENKNHDYILKEAEMLVSNYISVLEAKSANKKIENQKFNIKYKRLKNYASVVSMLAIIETLILLIQ